ncbi:MAG: hypothetical protein R2795_02825 [Saprospiraceae bacterium]
MKKIATWGVGAIAIYQGITANGCLKYDCGGFGEPNIRVCPDDPDIVTPVYSLQPSVPPTSCQQFEVLNLFGLIQADHLGWLNESEEYLGSSLKQFINTFQGVSFETIEKTRCANVYFCADNFNFLFSDNLDDIECEVVTIPVGSVSSWVDEVVSEEDELFFAAFDYDITTISTCQILSSETIVDESTGRVMRQVVRCKRPDCDIASNSACAEIREIDYCEIFSTLGIEAPYDCGDIPLIGILDDPYIAEFVSEVGRVTFQGYTFPKPILLTPQGNVFYDYVLGAGKQDKTLQKNLVQFIDNWDTGVELRVYSNEEENSYLISYKDSINQWIRIISSGNLDSIIYENAAINDVGDIVLSFWGKGSVFIDGELLQSNTEGSLTTISLMSNNSLVDVSRVIGLSELESKAVQYKNNGDFVAAININPERTITIGVAQFHSIQYEQNETIVTNFNASTKNFSTSGKFLSSETTKIQSVSSFKGGQKGVLFENTSDISYAPIQDTYSLHITEENNWLFVLLGESNESLWAKKIQCERIHNSTAEKLNNGDVILAITFDSVLVVDEKVYISNGRSDILVLQFSPEGALVEGKVYGSTGTESVERLFLNEQHLYLIGSMFGDTDQIEIDGQLFKRYIPSIKDEFVALLEFDYTSETTQLREDKGRSESITTKKQSANTWFSVFPNPFNDEISLELHSSENGNGVILLTDFLGRQVLRQPISYNQGYNLYKINLADNFHRGILNLSILVGNDKETLSTKIIRQ